MRFSASGLILFGLYLLGDAVYDQQRGIAEAYAPGGRIPRLHVVHRDANPRDFEGLMQYQWIRAGAALGAGLVLFGIYRRLDRSDPLHSDFAGKAALEELDQKLTAEQEKFHRPLR